MQIIVVSALAAACAPSSGGAEHTPTLLDNMDRQPVLRLVNSGPSVKVLSQSIQRGQSRFGAAAERIVVSAPPGSSAPLAYELPPATVIQELSFAAWVSCNRPGVQLAAAVVLPRSVDPRTGLARQLLLRSGKLADAGDWRLLTLENLPALLADQARVARAAPDIEIDEHEAYVTQLVILAPGGPGNTEVWVDQITAHGILNRPATLAATIATPSPQASGQPGGPAASLAAGPAIAKPPDSPRIIQWQGEPLKLLRDIGFDAIWMGRPPNEAERTEAQQLGLFIVSPPPPPQALASEDLSAAYQQVMAWDLGSLVDPAEIDAACQWSQAVERFDRSTTRPVLLRPSGLTREASRIADVIILGRPTIGVTQSWTDYAAWLTQQRRESRPGTPVWVAVDTHISRRAMAQLAALRGQQTPAASPATFNELAQATTASLGARPLGYCFTSQASLATDDADARMRRLALELTNLRLGLAAPWLASGKAATPARSSQATLTGLVLKVERSYLIVPLRWSDDPPPATIARERPISFILPGIPESSDAYLVSVSGSEDLRASRVTGGLEILVDQLPDDAFLLVTEDGYAFSHVERYLRKHAWRAAQARIELAALRRQRAASVMAALSPAIVRDSGAAEELAEVDRRLTAVVDTMRRRDFAAAYKLAAQAEAILDRAGQELAAAAAANLDHGVGPVAPRWSTLADCAAVTLALAQAPAPSQQMPGGEFEDLAQLLDGGWQRMQNAPPGIQAAVRLSPEAAAHGRYCLELEARQATPSEAPPTLPTPPVWITSPPLTAPAGHLVEITGMVRMAEPTLGSADPLLIFDSIGGEESALRIQCSPSWTPFQMVRAVPPGAELRVTIALGGLGRAQFDSLAYRFIPLNRQNLARAAR